MTHFLFMWQSHVGFAMLLLLAIALGATSAKTKSNTTVKQDMCIILATWMCIQAFIYGVGLIVYALCQSV